MRRAAKTLSLPVWQRALIAHGCKLETGNQTLPLKVEPVGEALHVTPTSSGSMLPFNIPVRVGQTVTITWDSELSRYIVESSGRKTAA
jgi:hypothetical protein